MKTIKYFTIVSFTIICFITTKAQLSLPYYTGFDTPTEQSGWMLYKLGVNATYGPWTVSSDFGGGYSSPNSLFHDYNDNGTVEDWYISPALNFTTSSVITLKIKAFVINGISSSDYFGIWYSSNSQNPSSGNFAEVADLTTIATSNDQWTDTTINLPITAGAGYIGFKYKNVDNWFTINIDNVNITALSTGVLEMKSIDNLLIYPNPSSGKIIIKRYNLNNPASIEIYNLHGEKIVSEYTPKTVYEIDLSNYPKGIYYAKIIEGTTIYSKKIIIE